MPATITAGGSAVVSGVLVDDAGGVSGASIELLQRPAGTAGEWSAAATPTTTGADGAFSFRVAPSTSTDYQARSSGGSGDPVAQADARVTVRPRLTFSAPSGLWAGETVLLRGSVAPAHPPGTVVVVDRKVDGVWQQLLTVSLDASSRFSIRWTPVDFGYYRLRARMEADTEHDAGVSASRTVVVNRSNAHDVPMRYAHYVVIVRHEYRLYYYEHGVLVRGFDVALGRPGYRTPLGLFRVYGKRKPAGGALGACAMFYRRQGGIAIHGTNRPSLIRRPAPRGFSHGCARMLNRQVLWLYARVPVGTRVHNLK
jgi:lipoprotein-anchoring transpeptidase ErfK/SrfK